MSVVGGIRAGLAFVELKAHDTEFQAAMLRFQERMVGVGSGMRRLATQVGVASAALGVPMVAGIRAAQGFDDAIRGVAAAVSDISPEQLEAVRKESLRLAGELGVAPEKIAEQFLNLAKAGVSVDDALGGAAKTAAMFAEVGRMEGGQAAELLADAMNVFGTSAKKAGDAIVGAANASSVDIPQMAMAFSMAGAVAGEAGQSIEDTSAALAILGKGMLKGSDAGTSLKTMLLRLTAPLSETKVAMAEIGLNARSFVDAANKPLRLPEIIGILNKRLGKLDDVARRDVLNRIFGSDAIRAALLLSKAGSEGFDKMLGDMGKARPLAEQFQYLMGGVTGFFSALDAGAKIMSVSFNTSLGPALSYVGRGFIWVSEKVAWMLDNVPGLGPVVGSLAGGLGVLSGALFGVATATAVVNFTMKNLPFKAVTRGAAMAAGAFGYLGKAAGLLRLAMTAIPGVGWVAGIATALTAAGAAYYWFTSKKKKNPAPQVAAGGDAAAMPAPAELQAAMAAAAPVRGRAAARPILGPGEQTMLSTRRMESLLQELVDISRGQRPAWG